MKQIDSTYLTNIIQRLVQIDSRNPDLTPGAPAESEIAAYVASLLRELNLEVIEHDLGNGRVNVVGILRGQGDGKTLMLNGHLDTVGVEGMVEPFSGAIRDGKLYGRGSFDMKGSVAAQIALAKVIVDSDVSLNGDLIITFVADEEYASIGTADIVKHYSADAAIVTEPTGFGICVAHRGFVWYEVETFGRAAHGSRYMDGIDANMHMGRFLGELAKLEQELRSRTPHSLVGTPSLHAAQIQGGTELSAYAANCILRIERRLNPGETEQQTTSELQEIINRLSSQDENFKATLKPLFIRRPYETKTDSPFVQLVAKNVAHHRHQDAEFTGTLGWTDAEVLGSAGIEAILLGPIGEGAHAAVEWVDLKSVEQLVDILFDIVVEHCGTN